MMPKIVSMPHSPYVLKTTHAKQKQIRPCREHRYGTDQIPSKG